MDHDPHELRNARAKNARQRKYANVCMRKTVKAKICNAFNLLKENAIWRTQHIAQISC